MAILKCVECNSNVSDKAAVCPHCGCPVIETVKHFNAKRKKLLLIIMSVVITVIVMVMAVFAGIRIFNNNNIKKGYYNNIKWGISKERLQAEVGESCIDNSDRNCLLNAIFDFEGYKGVSAMEIYYYDDNFYKVSVLLTPGDECVYSGKTIVDKIKVLYDERYGKHEDEAARTIWKTSKSMISLYYFSENLISIDFEDVNKIDSE